MKKTQSSAQLLTSTSSKQWKNIGSYRRAGIVAPLFSIYSRESAGIGDFSDLELLIDWCAQTGNSIIQLLPANETGPLSCPYDSISSFAIEPAYISFRAMPQTAIKPFADKIKRLKNKFPLTNKKHLDYRVKNEKLKLLWEIFLGDREKGSEEFKKFIKANSFWLDDFALFKTLKFVNQQKAWHEWEKKYQNRQPCALQEFRTANAQAIDFYRWLQWQTFRQFCGIKQYAKSKNVLLKGDLPVLVSKDSADVWANQEFFKLDLAAGAPPDMYCALGQRWGMPTYNWEKIAASGYKYIKEKMRYAENFYDILRIDHVVGLFRIWSIPVDCPVSEAGLNGFFDPRDENLWENQGRKVLSTMIDSSKLLLCAEDLGVIPPACPKTLVEFGIPGNDVQRWNKDWKITHDFLKPDQYRELSVSMLSTHDTTNWAAWWENEAGTIDEELFRRKCADRGINYETARKNLFNSQLSGYGRLRWKNDIDSIDKLAYALSKPKNEIEDFIEMYENTYNEKEKLWLQMGEQLPAQEKASHQTLQAMFNLTLASKAVFCVNLLNDWLLMAGLFKGDAYQYRINQPGTVNPKNWSLLIPLPLEELLEHKICQQIKKIIRENGRL